jgi:Phosphate transport regulator (distant homolog of PhoU)
MKSKRQVNFYQLLINQSDKTLEGIKMLHQFCVTGDDDMGQRVIEIEKEGDLQRRILIDEINNTFITPIEREDLFDLSRTVDDILDYARTTVEEFQIYNIQPNDDIKAMVSILVDMTTSLNTAIHQLENHKQISTEEAVKAKKFENSVEEMYRKSLARLFESDDIKYILKNRELYRHLSNAADKGDLAANILCHIIVKCS